MSEVVGNVGIVGAGELVPMESCRSTWCGEAGVLATEINQGSKQLQPLRLQTNLLFTLCADAFSLVRRPKFVSESDSCLPTTKIKRRFNELRVLDLKSRSRIRDTINAKMSYASVEEEVMNAFERVLVSIAFPTMQVQTELTGNKEKMKSRKTV